MDFGQTTSVLRFLIGFSETTTPELGWLCLLPALKLAVLNVVTLFVCEVIYESHIAMTVCAVVTRITRFRYTYNNKCYLLSNFFTFPKCNVTFTFTIDKHEISY